MFWFATITALGLFILFILLFFLSSKKPTKFWYITSSKSLKEIVTAAVTEVATKSTDGPLLVPVNGN